MSVITVRGRTFSSKANVGGCSLWRREKGLKEKHFPTWPHSLSYAENIVLAQTEKCRGGGEPNEGELKQINIVCGRWWRREGEIGKWEGRRGCTQGRHNHTYRTRLHPMVPGAPTARSVSLPVSQKERLGSPACLGAPIAPVAAWFNFLQAQFRSWWNGFSCLFTQSQERLNQAHWRAGDVLPHGSRGNKRGFWGVRVCACVRACVGVILWASMLQSVCLIWVRTCDSGVPTSLQGEAFLFCTSFAFYARQASRLNR